MPTYAFTCSVCNASITIDSPMNELKTPKCLKCQTLMTRDYSFSAIRFVGEGFYSKDSK